MEATMSLGTILLIILILILLGALPTWPYSAGWGYYPCPCRKLKHERIDGEARLRSVPKSGDRLPALAVARASPCAMTSAYELHCSIVDKKRAGTEDAARRKQRRGPDSPVGLNQ